MSPTPNARVCPKLSKVPDKQATGLDTNIFKACKASLDAALTFSTVIAGGLGAVAGTPQPGQTTTLSGICVPHFWQKMAVFLPL
jgi:hypothetical protein